MIQSQGRLVKTTTVWQEGTPFLNWPGRVDGVGASSGDYLALYRRQMWVYTVVRKRASGVARLPLKVYMRSKDGSRGDAGGSPYGKLLLSPSTVLSKYQLWRWVSITYDLFGEAWLAKRRNSMGTVVELLPLHPSAMTENKDADDPADRTWTFDTGKVRIEDIRRADLVRFRDYEGVSPLEPLRSSLEAESAAIGSTAAFWKNGARPRYALSHPRTLSQDAKRDLKAGWDSVSAGVGNTGGTVILEEGMKPELLSMSASDAEYIDTRKLHREEVCAAYDIPPPAVHILDRATFSNITEQMRSLYRESHAPRLNEFEATLELELRGAVNPATGQPDFRPDFYAEFLLDEVLRGDFEQRMESYSKADFMTIAEKRRLENLPYIEGTDRIYVNGATIPLDLAGVVNARQPAPETRDVRKVCGALARGRQIHDLSVDWMLDNLDDPAPIVDVWSRSLDDGDSTDDFVRRLKEIPCVTSP